MPRELIRLIQPEDDAEVAKLLAESFMTSPSYGYIFTHPDSAKRQSDLAWFFHCRLGINRDMGCIILGVYLVDDDSDAEQKYLTSSSDSSGSSSSSKSTCVATLTLGPIESQTPPLWVQLRHGLLLWPIWFGFPSLFRAMSLGKVMTDQSERANAIHSSDSSNQADSDKANAHASASASASSSSHHSSASASHPSHRPSPSPLCQWELMMVATRPSHQGHGYATRLVPFALTKIRRAGDCVCLSTQSERTVRFYERVGGFRVTSHRRVELDSPRTAFESWTMRLKF